MNTLLAIIAMSVFVLTLIMFLINSEAIARDYAIKKKKYNDVESDLASAEQANDVVKAEKLRKELLSMSFSMLGAIVANKGGRCLGTFIAICLFVMKIILIFAALSQGIGNPVFGYTVIAIFVALFIYGSLFTRKNIAREKAKAEANGAVYVYKEGWVIKILNTVPGIYALYIFLVLVGVITTF